MNYIIIILLVIIIIILADINEKLPKRDHVKDALARDAENKKKNVD